jgi:hypothetical protein
MHTDEHALRPVPHNRLLLASCVFILATLAVFAAWLIGYLSGWFA